MYDALGKDLLPVTLLKNQVITHAKFLLCIVGLYAIFLLIEYVIYTGPYPENSKASRCLRLLIAFLHPFECEWVLKTLRISK